MKPIRLSDHAREQLTFRGCSELEISEAICVAPWEDAELGRLECRLDFTFRQRWNGRWYETKQVRPIFVDNPDEVVVVTVYVYYF